MCFQTLAPDSVPECTDLASSCSNDHTPSFSFYKAAWNIPLPSLMPGGL